jgi:serine/threonine-protein kinase
MPDEKTSPPADAYRRTLADSPAARSSPDPRPPEPRPADELEPAAGRYEMRDQLGEGGMGEVYLCVDHRVGRDIAMKVIRRERGVHADAQARFVREARVQGQLEHPSIVPVYDMGRDASGSAYFTMRRVRGKTLEQVIDELHAGVPATAREWTRHKLLTAFGSVCLAVEFAHARGVLHRDLKPDNIMFGDFGEIYVLDWGLAKVIERRDGDPESRRAVTPDPAADEAHRTIVGAVMGTPGYMAPEQARRDDVELDARTDVYALGAILFELLAYEPLHARGSSDEVLRSTLRGADARPSVRAPSREVAPELDAICVRATAVERSSRYESAREIYDAVESFLAGDRDVERRRTLAKDHARAAAEATERALRGDGDTVAERALAMREVSRAVALDPTNVEAMKALVRLFTELPRELPPEASADLSRSLVHAQRVSSRTAALGYASWLLYAPLVLWMGVRDVKWGALCDLLFAVAAAANWYVGRVRESRVTLASDLSLVASTVAIAVSTGVAGPFMLLPGIAAVNTILYVSSAARSRRTWAVAAGCLAFAVPFALEVSGALPPSLAFDHGALVTLPQIASFPPVPSLVFLFLTNIAVIVTASILVARSRDALHATQERLYFHTWQLRQFVPGDAYGAATPSIAPPAR